MGGEPLHRVVRTGGEDQTPGWIERTKVRPDLSSSHPQM